MNKEILLLRYLLIGINIIGFSSATSTGKTGTFLSGIPARCADKMNS